MHKFTLLIALGSRSFFLSSRMQWMQSSSLSLSQNAGMIVFMKDENTKDIGITFNLLSVAQTHHVFGNVKY